MDQREYQELIRQIREVARGVVPLDATVAVVSKGDHELLELDGRQAWHFPQADDGRYAGYYPRDSEAAIAHLEALRAHGAEFLLFPGSASWWLDHYDGFRRHLESRYQTVWRDGRCIIYQLSGPESDLSGTLGEHRPRARNGSLAAAHGRGFTPRVRPLRQPRAETPDSLRPVLASLNQHFDRLKAGVFSRLEELEQRVAADTRTAALDREAAAADAQTAAELSVMHDRIIFKLEQRLAAVADQIADLEAGLGERLATLADRAVELEERLAERLAAVADRSADLAAKTLVNRQLPELGEGTADLLNYAIGHRGFAAQGGLWVNHPILIQHREADVALAWVNERVIEAPYVFRALADLPHGSHLLDFGATESVLSLSLACLGHDVVALDLRPYPFTHPRIRAVAQPAEQWDGPDRPFDAIISLSTLEHVGLGAYGGDRARLDLDREILERFRGWLRPGGLLVLTAPYGHWAVDDFQRTYNAECLDRLLEGWEVFDRIYGLSVEDLRWDTVEAEPPPSTWDSGARGVVMLQARPAP